MTISLTELKNEAKQIDCCNFIKRKNPLRKPRAKYEGLEMEDLPDNLQRLSKQTKIKLLSQDQD